MPRVFVVLDTATGPEIVYVRRVLEKPVAEAKDISGDTCFLELREFRLATDEEVREYWRERDRRAMWRAIEEYLRMIRSN